MSLRSDAAEIVFDHVTKRYAGSGRPAVDDLSLTIPAGEICVLIGPSGGRQDHGDEARQSADHVTEGDITIDGTSVMKLDPGRAAAQHRYVIPAPVTGRK